jgi:hypothetical protein
MFRGVVGTDPGRRSCIGARNSSRKVEGKGNFLFRQKRSVIEDKVVFSGFVEIEMVLFGQVFQFVGVEGSSGGNTQDNSGHGDRLGDSIFDPDNEA